MPKNIQMNILDSDGQYDVLYPETNAEQVLNLETTVSQSELMLSNSTKTLMGINLSSTPNDAFKFLYLNSVLGDKCNFTLTVYDSNSKKPLINIPIECDSFITATGDPVSSPLYTDNNGSINTFFKGGNVKLTINGFADIENWSQQYNVSNGEIYNYSVYINTLNFQKYVSSTSLIFSSNVEQLDITCVGGGGGAGGNKLAQSAMGTGLGCGGGGGGGYCVIQENFSFTPYQSYNLIIGSGGSGVSHTSGFMNGGNGQNGGQTSFDTIIAQGGSGGNGGTTNVNVGYGGNGGNGNGNGGAGGNYMSEQSFDAQGKNGSDGSVYGYSSFTETVLYGGGGGGGSFANSYVRIYGGTGGTYGGGSGGGGYGSKYYGESFSVDNGTNGKDGYGGGGGCAGVAMQGKADGSVKPSSEAQGGNGGSGCVTIRMHLKSS